MEHQVQTNKWSFCIAFATGKWPLFTAHTHAHTDAQTCSQKKRYIHEIVNKKLLMTFNKIV